MELEECELQRLQFDILKKYKNSISSGVFLRHGGVSEGAYSSLNLSVAIGDHPDYVKVNRSFVQKQIGTTLLVFAKQNHGADIAIVTLDNINDLPEADGLITKDKDIGLAITHADCQAAIFYDPENNIIGAAHAGWRGLVTNIYSKMVDKFISMGTKIDDLQVCIAPSLGPKHSEFKNYKKEFPSSFWPFKIEDSLHFNLWDIAEAQLLEAGLQKKNIEIKRICTYATPKDYFSYRRENLSGRNATAIAILE